MGTLDLEGCDSLALAPGAQLSTPAKAIVTAYASHLIVEPHKSTLQLEHLLTFLEGTPLNKQGALHLGDRQRWAVQGRLDRQAASQRGGPDIRCGPYGGRVLCAVVRPQP